MSAASASEAESEDDIYGGQRGRTFAKKHRQILQAAASGQDTPNLSAVRFSTRRAAKTTNYNEDDDLGLSEEDTESMTPNYWSYVDDNTPAIDQVLNHRLKEGAGEQKPVVRP
jgi:chromodomain-helicase-DNA-binding protein 1